MVDPTRTWNPIDPEDYGPRIPRILDIARKAQRRLDDDDPPRAFMLERVPQANVDAPGPRCPATYTHANELSYYLEYMGQSCGYEDFNGWRCDIAYTLMEVLTGYAYGPSCTPEDPRATEAAYAAMGLPRARYFASSRRGAYLPYGEMKRLIVHAIARERRPVIVEGLEGLFFGCLVVGYEDDGDVLVGWHYPPFDFENGLAPQKVRCERWYRADTALTVIGARAATPPLGDLYRLGLESAYRYGVLGIGALHEQMAEWARFLRMDREGCRAEVRRTLRVPGSWEELTYDDLSDDTIDKALLSMADPLWCDYAERRYYASNFLRQASARVPEHVEAMREIAGMYWRCDELMNEYDRKCGHVHDDGLESVDADAFWDPTARVRLAEIVDECLAREREIAERMRALFEDGMGMRR